MNAVRALDVIFDAAVAGAVVSVVLLIWTLAFVWAQAILTCTFVALVALYALARLDRPTPPRQPTMPPSQARQDSVSESEFDETMMPL